MRLGTDSDQTGCTATRERQDCLQAAVSCRGSSDDVHAQLIQGDCCA